MSAVATAHDQIDERIRGLLDKLPERGDPVSLKRAVNFMRSAYLDGYVHALTDETPMTEEAPMLRYHELFLP